MNTPLTHTAAWWTANNPILADRQIGLESDTNIIKWGDGVTAWNSLAYQEPKEAYTQATGTNTYVASLKMPSIFALHEGLMVRVKFINGNTGAATLNLNSFGAVAIKKGVSIALASGDILAGQIMVLCYDGTNWQIISYIGNGIDAD